MLYDQGVRSVLAALGVLVREQRRYSFPRRGGRCNALLHIFQRSPPRLCMRDSLVTCANGHKTERTYRSRIGLYALESQLVRADLVQELRVRVNSDPQ